MYRRLIISVGLAAMIAGSAVAAPKAKAPAAPPLSAEDARAKAVQDRLITLDTHLDTPARFALPGWDIMDRHAYDKDGSQVDYPRMVAGGLDGGFFAVFTPAQPLTPEGDHASRDMALVRATEIHEMLARHGDHFALALKADDAAKIAPTGKRIVYISMENSQPVEADLSLMTAFYKLGVRLMGPAHFKSNDLADSATDAPKWHGLSPKGREFVAEANRLGIVLDASHSSDDVFDQMLELSKAPILLSHSGSRAIFNHPRSLDDARMKALAAKGGVIQIYAFNSYMIAIPPNPERDAAYKALGEKMHANPAKSQAEREAYYAERKAIEAKYPIPEVDFETFMAHLNHALQVAGVDHVGIGLDMDGGGGVKGLRDVSDDWKITARLLKEGYSEADLQKIWSGNVLRVLRAAEVEAAREQAPAS